MNGTDRSSWFDNRQKSAWASQTPLTKTLLIAGALLSVLMFALAIYGISEMVS